MPHLWQESVPFLQLIPPIPPQLEKQRGPLGCSRWDTSKDLLRALLEGGGVS